MLLMGVAALVMIGQAQVSAQLSRTSARFGGSKESSGKEVSILSIAAMDETFPRSGSIVSSRSGQSGPVKVASAEFDFELPPAPRDDTLAPAPARLSEPAGGVSERFVAEYGAQAVTPGDDAILAMDMTDSKPAGLSDKPAGLSDKPAGLSDKPAGLSASRVELSTNAAPRRGDDDKAVYFDPPEDQTQRRENLEDLWNIALESSRKLQSKDFQYAEAQEKASAARGVGLPKVTNASGWHAVSEQYAIEGSIDIVPGVLSMPFQTAVLDQRFATSITALTVPVYMGGRVRGMIEAANSAAAAIASGREIGRLDLKFEVAQTYLLVLRVRSLLRVAEEAERTLEVHRKDAQRLFDTGIVNKNVLLTAEAALANARHDVLKARNAVALSEAALNRLLWRPLNTPVNICECPIPERSGDLESLTAEAEHARPELAALAHKSQALSAQAKVKRADRLPQIALVGSHNYMQNSHLSTDQSLSGSVGMVWTPIDGGVSRAQQQAAEYEAMSVTKEYEDARTGIELQVYQAWLEEEQSRDRVEVARKAVEQAAENLRVTTNSFREGLVGHSEVLDATTLWTMTESNLANARYDAIAATFSLRRAVGNL